MRFSLWIALAIIGGSFTAQDRAVEQEMRRLQGKWAQVVVESDGRRLTDKVDDPKVTVTVRGGKWLESAVSVPDGDAADFKIDPAKDPKWLDLSFPEGKPKTFPAIYRLEGDTLTTAVPYPFEGDESRLGERPNRFHTRPGDGFVVIVYKRIKP